MLREFIVEHASAALAVGGLAIGFVFGAIAYRTNFCTMGALSDLRTLGDKRRLNAWLFAIAVAIAGTHLLAAAGVVALDKTMYTQPTLNWAGGLIGGLMFGYGMVFAGGCATRNVTRLGGGDLRALVTIVLIGLFGYMAIGGVFGPARAALESATAFGIGAPTQTLPALVAGPFGLGIETANLWIGLAVAALLAGYCLTDLSFRTAPLHVFGGFGVGLSVVAGWALTGLAFDDFADKPLVPISLTFVRPAGDTLEWLARYTALGLPTFGVATVFGTLLGAFAVAVMMGRFRLIGFTDTDDTVRHLMGASLMGVGGVLALGCTIGQGITGISTLAVGSMIALAAIVVGGWFGLAALERRLEAAV